MFPLSLRVCSLSVPTECMTFSLKGKNHTYCMSATGPPCIKLSCFSVIAVISDIILSKIRFFWVSKSALNTALGAADGWNTDSKFHKVSRTFWQATFTPSIATEIRNHSQVHYLLSAGRCSTLLWSTCNKFNVCLKCEWRVSHITSGIDSIWNVQNEWCPDVVADL